MSAGHYYPYNEIVDFFKDADRADAFCKMREQQPKGFLVGMYIYIYR